MAAILAYKNVRHYTALSVEKKQIPTPQGTLNISTDFDEIWHVRLCPALHIT